MTSGTLVEPVEQVGHRLRYGSGLGRGVADVQEPVLMRPERVGVVRAVTERRPVHRVEVGAAPAAGAAAAQVGGERVRRVPSYTHH
jgi:hypothetical protein